MSMYREAQAYIAENKRLPEGFKVAHVVLTDKEWDRLHRRAARLAEGTVSAALREAAGLPENPYGLKALLKRWKKEMNT